MTTTTADAPTVEAPTLPRGRRHVAAVIVAVLLLIVSGYVAWQAIVIQAHRSTTPFSSKPVSDYLGRTSWHSAAVLTAGIVLAALGLWLLLSAIIAPRRKLIELRETDTATSTGIRRADLLRAVNLAAESVDGVASARTRLSGSTAAMTITSPLGRPGTLRSQVSAVVTERLRELNPVKPLDLTVALNSKQAS